MAGIGTILSIVGTVVSAAGTLAAGRQAQAQAEYQARAFEQQGKIQQQGLEYEARQLELAGKEEQAASQREADDQKREKNLALSRLQTQASASGFTATDPTSLAIADEIARYGTFKQQIAAYGGKARRANLEDQAAGARYEGEAAIAGANASAAGARLSGRSARQQSLFSAFGTLAGGLSKGLSRYNQPFASTSTSSYRYG
jgi:hypothetical protein